MPFFFLSHQFKKMKKLQLTEYALLRIEQAKKAGKPLVIEKGTHRITLNEKTSQADLNLLFGSETYVSAWAELAGTKSDNKELKNSEKVKTPTAK